MELAKTFFLDAEQYGKFSKLIQDYLAQKEQVRSFYGAFPSEQHLLAQAEKKLNAYQNRAVTAEVLEEQMNRFSLSDAQKINLDQFKQSNTVCITTGHQLNLFTGPLYFFYKILQTIKCCAWMSEKHPQYNFVPVFWMATEDHDFEEINHFYFQNEKISWDRPSAGAVGRMDLSGIEEAFHPFFEKLNSSQFSQTLKDWVHQSYLSAENLTEATQKLVQALFGEWGLLFLDADDRRLKQLMLPYFEEDLLQQTAHQIVGKTNESLLEKGYTLQVHPREINLFYLGNGTNRERIVALNGKFHVLHSNSQWTQEELLEELKQFPEKFSPNVILRPLYQECILPNIAYIGGSGEMAYWLQLKDFFDAQKVLFPVLIVRNSLLILTEKQRKKLEKLGVSYSDLLLSKDALLRKNTVENRGFEVDFQRYEKQIQQMFDELQVKAQLTDMSFSKMVDAQQKKQLKGLDKLKKRLIHAEMKQQSDRVTRLAEVYEAVHPQGNLQERTMNFSELYLEFGEEWLRECYAVIQPIDFQFTIKSLG